MARFPPSIFYKIYTHGNVVDLGSFAPREYHLERMSQEQGLALPGGGGILHPHRRSIMWASTLSFFSSDFQVPLHQLGFSSKRPRIPFLGDRTTRGLRDECSSTPNKPPTPGIFTLPVSCPAEPRPPFCSAFGAAQGTLVGTAGWKTMVGARWRCGLPRRGWSTRRADGALGGGGPEGDRTRARME